MALELFLFPVEPREGMNPQLSNAGSGQGCRTQPCRRRAAFAPGSARRHGKELLSWFLSQPFTTGFALFQPSTDPAAFGEL